MPPAYLNYTTLGLKGFEVFPHKLAYDGVLVDEILGPICEKLGYTFFVRSSELWLLKEPIPFDQISSNRWLLDGSTDLAEYATKAFRAERMSYVWTNRESRHLHAILRVVSAI